MDSVVRLIAIDTQGTASEVQAAGQQINLMPGQKYILDAGEQSNALVLVQEGNDLLVFAEEGADIPALVLEDYYIYQDVELFVYDGGSFFTVGSGQLAPVPESIAHTLAEVLTTPAIGATSASFVPLALMGGFGGIAAASMFSESEETEQDKKDQSADKKASFSGDLSAEIADGNDVAVITGELNVKDANGKPIKTENTKIDGQYGKFVLENGKWTYTLDKARAETMALGDKEKGQDSFDIKASDGTIQKVVISVEGKDDAAVIAGSFTGAVTGNAADSTVTGTITISDVDSNDNPVINAETKEGTYGNLEVAADGKWVYTLDNSREATQSLDEGETQTELFTIVASDGTSQDITITVTGANDEAVVSGDFSGSVTEDADPDTVSGSISIVDADKSDNPSFENTEAQGVYGKLVLNDGNWTYTLDNSLPATQKLDEGETKQEVFTISDSNGNDHSITITVTGAKDTAIISGNLSGKVVEDAAENVVTGQIEVSVQPGFDPVTLVNQDATSGKYGNFSLQDGKWSYTLDNSREATQALNEGEKAKEVFEVKASDGTIQEVVISVEGKNDTAVITGETTGSIVQNTEEPVTGSIKISDVDSNDNPVINAETQKGTYGDFEIAADGKWVYTLDNNREKTKNLSANDREEDVFTINASDGTNEVITISVSGEYGINKPDFYYSNNERLDKIIIRPEDSFSTGQGARMEMGELEGGGLFGEDFRLGGNDVVVLKDIGFNSTVDTGSFIEELTGYEDGHDSITLKVNMNNSGSTELKTRAELKTGSGNDFVFIEPGSGSEAGNDIHGLLDRSLIDTGIDFDYVKLDRIDSGATLILGPGHEAGKEPVLADDDVLQFMGSLDNLQGHVDGGDGIDMILFDHVGDHNLAEIADNIQNIEILDITNGSEDKFTIDNAETLQLFNESLVGPDIDLSALVKMTEGPVHRDSPLGNILHIAGDDGDKLDLFGDNWEKTDITHETNDVWFRSANTDYYNKEKLPGGEEINHAEHMADDRVFTLYQHTGDNNIDSYIFVENGISII